MIDRLMLAFYRLFRKRLSVFDMKVSKIGYMGLQATKMETRIGMYELVEIIRLTHKDPCMRKNASEIQQILLAWTKTKDNLLPHERLKQNPNDKDISSDLLPRHDLFF